MRIATIIIASMACCFGVAEASSDAEKELTDEAFNERMDLIEVLPIDFSKQDYIDCYGTSYLAEQSALAAGMPQAVTGAQFAQSVWLDALFVHFDFEAGHNDLMGQTSNAKAQSDPGFSFMDMRSQQGQSARSCMTTLIEATKKSKAKASK